MTMITAMLCSFALQSTPGTTTQDPASPARVPRGAATSVAAPGGSSSPVTGSDDFLIGQNSRERGAPSRPQDDFFIGQNAVRGGAAATPEAEVTRTYDVRALGLADWKHDDEGSKRGGLRLVPSLEMEYAFTPGDGGGGPGLADERWVNLLVDLLGRTAQADGRSVVVSTNGQLIVSGPPALHTSVEALLALVSDVTAGETRLVLDVVRMELADALALDGAFVPLARAVELARGASERYEVALRDDTGASIDAKREVPVLIDYEVEVANAAAMGEPVVAYCSLGTQLFARGAPARDGVHLAFAVKRGDLTIGRRTSGVGVMARHIGEDGRAMTTRCATLLDDPTWMATSFATSCFLPVDQALVLVGASEGGTCEVLLLSVAGQPAMPFRSAKFADGGLVALLHLGALVPPDLLAAGDVLRDRLASNRAMRSTHLLGDKFGLLSCFPVRGESAAVRDGLLRRLGRGFESWEIGPWLVLRGDERALIVADAVERRAASLQVDVRFEAGGQVLRTARLPMRLGSGGAVALTNETFDAVESDLEIAERSTCSDLALEHVFDGLVCWMRALPLGADRFVLETAGAAQLVGPRRVKEMDDMLVPALEERDVERLGLRDRRVLTKGADGVYRTVLGTQVGDGLRVVIELR